MTTHATLGFGMAAVGRPAYITESRGEDLGVPASRTVEALEKRAHLLLDTAWDLGVRYVDVARSYGRAEEFLGSWLRANPTRRAQLTIGSKWGYSYVGNWSVNAQVHEVKDHGLGMLTRQWAETRSAIGSAPDYYLIHSVTPDSPVLGDRAVLDNLRELRLSGLRVGLSTSGPHQGQVIESALNIEDAPFTVVQSTWNVLEPSAGPALTLAHDAGWTVVLKEILANGLLARTDDQNPLNGIINDARRASEYAIAAAAQAPWTDIVLSGATTVDQLVSNWRALGAAPAWDAPASLTVPPDQYWAQRAERAWA